MGWITKYFFFLLIIRIFIFIVFRFLSLRVIPNVLLTIPTRPLLNVQFRSFVRGQFSELLFRTNKFLQEEWQNTDTSLCEESGRILWMNGFLLRVNRRLLFMTLLFVRRAPVRLPEGVRLIPCLPDVLVWHYRNRGEAVWMTGSKRGASSLPWHLAPPLTEVCDGWPGLGADRLKASIHCTRECNASYLWSTSASWRK